MPLSQPNEIQKVRVTSAPYSIRSPSRTNVESKIVLPRDLCDGEDVLTIKDNEKLMKLKTEVMVSVYHEEQVLVVVLDNTDTLIEQVQKKFPSDNTITYFGWKPKKMKPRSTNGQGTLKKLFRVDTWFPRYRNEPSEVSKEIPMDHRIAAQKQLGAGPDFDFFFPWRNINLGGQILLMTIFETNYLLELSPIFDGSMHNVSKR